MKNKRYIFLLLALVMSSCTPSGDSSSNSPTDESDSQPTSGDSSNSDTSSQPRPTTGTEIVDFYAINDFHGAISFDTNFGEPGLSRIATYLKEKKEAAPDNSVILSSGDMWQGSYESYHNRGAVVTEAMNDIGFDAMTIGNHEFDWGTSDIFDNQDFADFPLLGANIMEYPNTNDKSPIGERFAIIERGFLKIGVIGVIGQDQITSISSRIMQDLYFADPTPIVKSISQELRDEHNVDIVVLSIHAGQEEVHYSIPQGKYVDAVFCSHTHQAETQVLYGVPFIQGGFNGKHVSNIRLSYNYENGQVTHISSQNTSQGQLSFLSPDSQVQSIIEQYGVASNVDKNRVVGTLLGNLGRYDTLPNIANYAAAMKADELGYDIDFAMTNLGRSDILSGTVTYGDLFKGLPFDNYMYIVRATGRNIKSQSSYNYFYRVNDYSTLSNNSYYTIAIVDYVVLHQDINKEYNYFSDYNPDTDYIDYLKDDATSLPFYPRDLVDEIFADAENNTINPYDYTGSRYSDLTV